MPKKIKKKKKVKSKLEKSKDLKKIVTPKKISVADQKIQIKKIKKQPSEKRQYNVKDFVALFIIIQFTVGSSKPVVRILTEVKIASGVSLNHFKVSNLCFFVAVLSKCLILKPAFLNVS